MVGLYFYAFVFILGCNVNVDMFIENRFWSSFNDFCFQPKLWYFEQAIGFDSVVKQMEIEAFDDAKSQMLEFGLIFSDNFVSLRSILHFYFFQQN